MTSRFTPLPVAIKLNKLIQGVHTIILLIYMHYTGGEDRLLVLSRPFSQLAGLRDLDLGILSYITHRPLLTYQISFKSDKTFGGHPYVHVHTYVRTDGH